MHTYSRVVFKLGAKVSKGYRSSHKAKDYAPRNDDTKTTYAVAAGTVTAALRGQKPGDEIANMVAVRSTDGSVTVYAHVAPSVSIGSKVALGDKVGTCDMSGDSSDYHVHLFRLLNKKGTEDEVLDGSVQEKAVNFKCRGELR